MEYTFGKQVNVDGRRGELISQKVVSEPHLLEPQLWFEVELYPTERDYGKTVWVRSTSPILSDLALR